MTTPRKLRIGSPATGDNFFPRQRLRNRLLRALARDHVAFLGPRRTGKTSILLDLAAHPPAEVVAVNLDLQGLRDIPAWLNLMLAEVKRNLESPPTEGWLKQAGSRAVAALKRVDEISLLGAKIKLAQGQPAVSDWQPVADQFLGLLKDHQLPIYFLLDEFPWFLGHVAAHHTTADVDAALNWFRKVRLQLTDLPARFLVTGSIGLRGLLRRLNLTPAANDFDTIAIEPFSESESLEFLEGLSAGEKLVVPVEARRRIFERLGVGWPLLLATFLAEVQDHCDEREVTIADVDRIYEERMVRGIRNKYCEEMHSRVAKQELFSATERRLSEEILRELCRQPDGFGHDDLAAIHARLVPDETLRSQQAAELDYVVETLIHDGYVYRICEPGSARDGRLTFASNILSDYWRHRTV